MAYSKLECCVTHEANVDLSSHKFRIVELMTTGKVRPASGGTGEGILQNVPQSGEAASVAIDGESKIIAGEALSIGDYIVAKSGGWAIAVTSGDALPLKVMGKVLVAAASGGIATARIEPQFITNVISGSLVAGLPA